MGGWYAGVSDRKELGLLIEKQLEFHFNVGRSIGIPLGKLVSV